MQAVFRLDIRIARIDMQNSHLSVKYVFTHFGANFVFMPSLIFFEFGSSRNTRKKNQVFKGFLRRG